MRHFELPYPIGETIEHRELDHASSRRRAVECRLDLSDQTVKLLSRMCIQVVRLGKLCTETRDQRFERLLRHVASRPLRQGLRPAHSSEEELTRYPRFALVPAP